MKFIQSKESCVAGWGRCVRLPGSIFFTPPSNTDMDGGCEGVVCKTRGGRRAATRHTEQHRRTDRARGGGTPTVEATPLQQHATRPTSHTQHVPII
jgi:hypothetical protein